MSELKHGLTEKRDVHLNYVLLAVASFVVLLIVGVVFAWIFFHDKIKNEMHLQTQYSTDAFPQPRLQPAPGNLLLVLHQHEDQVLNSYAWIDEDHARIPVERAMKLAVKKQLIGRAPHAP